MSGFVPFLIMSHVPVRQVRKTAQAGYHTGSMQSRADRRATAIGGQLRSALINFKQNICHEHQQTKQRELFFTYLFVSSMAPFNGINDEDGTLLSSISTDDDESVRKRKTIKFAYALTEQLSVSIAHLPEYSHNFNQGNQEEILRTIRAAGVKFIRVAYFLACYLRANFIPATFIFLPATYIFQQLICLWLSMWR